MLKSQVNCENLISDVAHQNWRLPFIEFAMTPNPKTAYSASAWRAVDFSPTPNKRATLGSKTSPLRCNRLRNVTGRFSPISTVEPHLKFSFN
jgi:hypothetical protein